MELDAQAAANLIRGYRLNLIKRGDDGSLVMSTDGWRLHHESDDALSLKADPPAPPDHPLTVIELIEVVRITWDRLPKQQTRSQVRFHLKNGDLLTFSGRLPDPEPR
ncbi:MAG: hypothetical protein U0893_05925 [Chloroflexota bacterium]